MIFIRTTSQGSMIMVLNYYLKAHTLQFLKLKLVSETKTVDLYEDLYGDKKLFDFSNYPTNLPFYDLVHKKSNQQNEG